MSYYSVDQVNDYVSNLAVKYSSMAEVVPLSDPTHGGRKCKALRISTALNTNPRRETILLIGGVHGAEWGSCEILLRLARDLLEALKAPGGLGYGGQVDRNGNQIGGIVFGAQELQLLFTRRDILIFPLVNPDGRHYSQTAATPIEVDWRKNRRPIVVNGVQAGIGVDINRNFDFVFDLTLYAPTAAPAASKLPTSLHYQGDKPESEAETRNVVELLDKHPVGWFVDLHSPGLSMCFAWNHDNAQTTQQAMNFRDPQRHGEYGLPGDPTPGQANYQEFLAAGDLKRMTQLAGRFKQVATLVSGGSPYDSRSAYWNTAYPGTSHDYAYSRHLTNPPRGNKALGFICEWGDMHAHPPWAAMQALLPEVIAGLIAFCIETTLPPPNR